MKQYKKRNTGGFSHHFLLPVIVVIAVAGIGGYVMLQSSSAATLCKDKVYAQGAKSECVRYAQYMIGAQPDAAFGPNTKKKLVAKTGQSKLNKAAWDKLCKGNYSSAVNKQRDAACKTGAKKPGNPTTGYRVCTKLSYSSPPYISAKPVKPKCDKYTKYKGVDAKAKAENQKKKNKPIMTKYKKDQEKYTNYVAQTSPKQKHLSVRQMERDYESAQKTVYSIETFRAVFK